jgi:uncharacterized protein YdgA (DUF945 family)
MRKLKIALALVLFLIAAAAAAFPWYLGRQAEQRFLAGLKHPALGDNSAVAVSLVQYERGWLNSSAVHRVALKADPDVYFDVHHAIRHLPDPERGLVMVHSTPRWPQKVQAAADYYFGNQPALSVHTVVDFDRNVSMTLESPAFSKPMLTRPEVKLTWGGGSGRISMTDPARVAVMFDLPRVQVDGSDLSATFADMKVQGDWDVTGNQAEWSGQTSMGIGELSLASRFGSASLKGVDSSVVQRNQGATVLVGYTLKVREGVTAAAGEQAQGFRDAVLEIELDRLDKQVLAKYFDDVADAERATVSAQAHKRLASQLAMGMMSELLKGSPEMRVKKLGMTLAKGSLSGSAVLGFDGNGMGQGGAPAEMLSRVKFSGSAELSTTLLQAWLEKQARAQASDALTAQGTPPEEARVHALTQQIAQQTLAGLEASGLLRAEGDKFLVRAELTAGSLSINGMAGDQFLPGLLPAMTPSAADDEKA